MSDLPRDSSPVTCRKPLFPSMSATLGISSQRTPESVSARASEGHGQAFVIETTMGLNMVRRWVLTGGKHGLSSTVNTTLNFGHV